MNTRTKRVFFDKLTYIYLEMPKFTKIQSELTTHFEKWLYLLKNLEKLSDQPEAMESNIFNKLFEQAEIACYSDIEYQEYEKSLKTYRDLKNSIDTAFDDGFVEGKETGFVKGKEEGLIEGERKGIEKGIEKGVVQGVINTAKIMKTKGVERGLIADLIGLSFDEIEAL
jgi:predicted transposase/invertase (TIGR01784 family)